MHSLLTSDVSAASSHPPTDASASRARLVIRLLVLGCQSKWCRPSLAQRRPHLPPAPSGCATSPDARPCIRSLCACLRSAQPSNAAGFADARTAGSSPPALVGSQRRPHQLIVCVHRRDGRSFSLDIPKRLCPPSSHRDLPHGSVFIVIRHFHYPAAPGGAPPVYGSRPVSAAKSCAPFPQPLLRR